MQLVLNDVVDLLVGNTTDEEKIEIIRGLVDSCGKKKSVEKINKIVKEELSLRHT